MSAIGAARISGHGAATTITATNHTGSPDAAQATRPRARAGGTAPRSGRRAERTGRFPSRHAHEAHDPGVRAVAASVSRAGRTPRRRWPAASHRAPALRDRQRLAGQRRLVQHRLCRPRRRPPGPPRRSDDDDVAGAQPSTGTSSIAPSRRRCAIRGTRPAVASARAPPGPPHPPRARCRRLASARRRPGEVLAERERPPSRPARSRRRRGRGGSATSRPSTSGARGSAQSGSPRRPPPLGHPRAGVERRRPGRPRGRREREDAESGRSGGDVGQVAGPASILGVALDPAGLVDAVRGRVQHPSPAARPPAGGWNESPIPLDAISHEITEFEFHISPVPS